MRWHNFSAEGDSYLVHVKAGKELLYTIDSSGTLGATIALMRSFTGGQTWETVIGFTGVAAGSIVVEASAHYKFSCTSYNSGIASCRLFDSSAPLQGIGCLGDSITNQCFDYSASFNGAAGDKSMSNYGWLFWWKFFSKSPITFKNYAVSGYTSNQVTSLALESAISQRHAIYTLEIGINDVLGHDKTIENIGIVYKRVMDIGAKLLIWTMSSTETFSATKARAAQINNFVRGLALSNPNCVKVIDAKSIYSDPNDAHGSTYGSSSGFDITYDTTHPNMAGGLLIGWAASVAAREWTQSFKVGPTSNGDSFNLLTNAALGGVSGTLPASGTGAVADSWTCSRSGSTVTSVMYKVNSVPMVLEAGQTPILGQRCKVLGINDYHYIVIETGTAASTLPSSTTLFSETEPDGAGGAKYLTLPANDKPGMQNPYQGTPYTSQYIDIVDSTAANSSLNLNQTVTTGFSVGDHVRASCYIEMLESAWQGFALRISATTSGSAKVHDAFGPSYSATNSLLLLPNIHGFCETPHDYIVPLTTANLIFRLYLFNRSPSVHTRCLVHHPILENLTVSG